MFLFLVIYNKTTTSLINGMFQEFKYFDEHRKIQWVGGAEPKAEPPCGFQGEKCIYKPDWRVIVTLSVLFSFLLVGGIFAFK
jgi:hypothetical protein